MRAAQPGLVEVTGVATLSRLSTAACQVPLLVRRSHWVTVAWLATVTFLLATISACGYWWGWWQALVTDAADAPWDWIERASWVIALISLPVAIGSHWMPMRESRVRESKPRRAWRLVPVSKCRPHELGVHRAAPPPYDSSAPPLPAYIPREHDTELRDRLLEVSKTGGMVVVVGGSSTGKSRSLYEAVRDVLSDWQILLADDVNAVRDAADGLPSRTVVWLDDTPSTRYLGPEGLSSNDLSILIDRRGDARLVLVVHVVWPEVYRTITEEPPPGRRDGDLWRHAREALQHADGNLVDVPACFSREEVARGDRIVAAGGDQRLAAALADEHYGVTQHLAGAPQLVDHWRYGADRNPYGAALITAAIDLRRLGIRQPLTTEFLEATLTAYLDGEDYADAPRTWFQDALAYATSPLRGGVRAIYPLPGSEAGTTSGYRLADYLEHVGVLDRHYAVVPTPVFDALIPRVTDPDDATRLAVSADDRGLVEHAKPLLRRVYRHSDQAGSRLVWILVNDGDEEELRRLTAEGVHDAGLGLVHLLIDQQRYDEIPDNWRCTEPASTDWWEIGRRLYEYKREEVLRRLDEAGDEDGRFFLIRLLQDEGREDALGKLADAGDRDAQMCRAEMFEHQGRIEEALEAYEDLFDCEEGDFADEAVRAWGGLLAAHGREAELRGWEAESEDPRFARMYLATLLANQERLDELRELAADRHPTVQYQYTALLRRLGCLDELREVAATDPWHAGRDLVALLETLGAESELRKMTAAGNVEAREHLINLLATLGREGEIRQFAAAGYEHARKRLVELLARSQRKNEIRRMAAAGDPYARSQIRTWAYDAAASAVSS
ncbi:hypothetical protein ACIBMZ_20815 [Micromonospora sp. NPDC049900]|uniref:hypothetical protein n=1 Tax=Micromonospora sp. NPDC049900 TaxID=3364275 RepID=UPI003796E761